MDHTRGRFKTTSLPPKRQKKTTFVFDFLGLNSLYISEKSFLFRLMIRVVLFQSPEIKNLEKMNQKKININRTDSQNYWEKTHSLTNVKKKFVGKKCTLNWKQQQLNHPPVTSHQKKQLLLSVHCALFFPCFPGMSSFCLFFLKNLSETLVSLA